MPVQAPQVPAPLPSAAALAPARPAAAVAAGARLRRPGRPRAARHRARLPRPRARHCAARSTARPTWCCARRTEQDVVDVLDWASGAGVPVVPFGGGSSVVGGVEPRGLDAAVSLDLSRLAGLVEVDDDLAGGAAAGRHLRAGRRGGPRAARADAALLPAVVRALDRRRLGRDPGRRPLLHPADARRRPRRVRSGPSRPAARGSRAACRARAPARARTACCSAARARSASSPRPGCARSRGRRTAGPPPSPPRTSPPAAGRCGRSCRPGCCRRPAGSSTPARRRSAGTLATGEAALVLGLESLPRRVDAEAALALELCRDAGLRVVEAGRPRRRRRGVALDVRARALPARVAAAARRAGRDLRDGHHLGPLRRARRRRHGGDRRTRCAASAAAAR